MDNLIYSFRGEIWTWSGKKTDWFFVTVPSEMSAPIRYFTSHVQRGFKSLKVRAQIGDTFWETSMFPSKQRTAYLLPVKKSVRDAEAVDKGDSADITITILGL